MEKKFAGSPFCSLSFHLFFHFFGQARFFSLGCMHGPLWRVMKKEASFSSLGSIRNRSSQVFRSSHTSYSSNFSICWEGVRAWTCVRTNAPRRCGAPNNGVVGTEKPAFGLLLPSAVKSSFLASLLHTRAHTHTVSKLNDEKVVAKKTANFEGKERERGRGSSNRQKSSNS